MIQPGRYDIGADRWVAFVRTFSFVGIDLSSATFGFQIRLIPDATGSPLVDLPTATAPGVEGVRVAYAGTDTVANHIAGERLDSIPAGLSSTSSILLSQITIRIEATKIRALPYPAERGSDVNFHYDLLITAPGKDRDKYLGGVFTVRAGVTQ